MALKKFEYDMFCVVDHDIRVERLNKRGAEGWELCYIIQNDDAGQTFLIFKREIIEG